MTFQIEISGDRDQPLPGRRGSPVTFDRLQLFRGTGGVLLHDFLQKALRTAGVYQRAAGYFSSSVFAIAHDEFAEFFAAGGRCELVTSPVWSAEDVEAIHEGSTRPYRYNAGVPPNQGADQKSSGPLMLGWAIASGRLHVKIAMPKSADPYAIFHEKFGILTAADNQAIAFEGSANESKGGYVANFERLRIVTSGRNSEALGRFRREFEDLWENNTPGLVVIDFVDALNKGHIRIRPSSIPGGSPDLSMVDETHDVTSPLAARFMAASLEAFTPPPRTQLREYQRDAIRAWFEAGGKGTLAMATGTGKTITALSAAQLLYARGGAPLAIVMVAPLLHLVDQWEREASRFGLRPIKCSGAAGDWESLLRGGIFAANNGVRPLLSIVVTLATFCSSRFQRVLEQLRVRTLLIVDEVHNAGSELAFRSLPRHIPLRLGLSATPERWMDRTGSDRIAEYFGGVVYRFGIREALQYDPPILTPYSYYPVIIELDQDEAEEYSALTLAIGRSLGAGDADDFSDLTLRLLVKRARLVASARAKLPRLRELIRPFANSAHTLVYCGDGSIDPSREPREEFDADRGVQRQIDAVAQILGRELGMRVNTYTADTAVPDRERLRREFEEGQLDALVAIRCLDEGLDIPSIRRAFILASSTNPKQFIQRRGRILRRAPGKERADIFDFIVRPPRFSGDLESADYRGMRGLIEREFRRVVEFAQDAVNRNQAELVLMPVLQEWGLLHL